MGNFFSKNLKFLRESKKISKNKLGEMVGVNQSTIGRWESNEITPSIDNVEEVARALNVALPDILIKDLSFDNAELIDLPSDNVKIPVFGTIKAGIPVECQSDIIDYIDIPKKWTRGNKEFYGLELSGDSMYPKYNDKDIVIFEKNCDVQAYNGKDVAVMINRTESTFKKIKVTEQGIILQPYNPDYDIMTFSKKQVEELPITVIGIARERRTKVE